MLAEDPPFGVDDLAARAHERGRARCGRSPRASPAGAKQSSWESGFVATGSPNRSASRRVSAFGSPPTGNLALASCACPSMWSM